jgi:putative flippase GtrA
MWIDRLYNLLFHDDNLSERHGWLILSFFFPMVFALWGICIGFGSPYIVQDDARQHVFWMARFMDPGLFPNDPIADYFQSVAPFGYQALYRVTAQTGVDPSLFNKLLPMPLGLIATYFCFRVSLTLFPVQSAAFLATLLLNLSIWAKDDLISGTPRAFVYPLLLAFLHFLLKRSLVPLLIILLLQGLFYPQIVLISTGILFLRIFSWRNGLPALTSRREDLRFSMVGVVAAILVILPFLLETSHYGPVISKAMAMTMPEFNPGGRSSFFTPNLLTFWVSGPRSGIFPREWFNWPGIFLLIILAFAALSPWMLRSRNRFILASRLDPEIMVLPRLAIVSAGLYATAHLFLFRLHIPSRYSHYSMRLLMAIGGAIAATILLEWLLRTARDNATSRFRKTVSIGVTLIFLMGALLYPLLDHRFPNTRYVKGNFPALYGFFQAQPKETLIASLSEEINNIPSFARRSIFVGSEYAIPYHLGYYLPFQRRVMDLIEAHYSPDPQVLKNFILRNRIDYFLLDDSSFDPAHMGKNRLLSQYREISQRIRSQLERGPKPSLQTAVSKCPVTRIDRFAVVPAKFILEHL